MDMLCEDYIYEKILGLSEDEIKINRKKLVLDKKRKFRLYTIENEGTDPAKEQIGDSFEDDDDNENEYNSREDESKQTNKPKNKTIADELFGADEKMGLDKSSHKHRYQGNSPLSLERIDAFLMANKRNKKIL